MEVLFVDGVEVVVVGLPTSSRNGRRGHIAGCLDTAGRFPVQPCTGRLLMLRPNNIALVSSAEAIATLAGCTVAKAKAAAKQWTLPPLHELFLWR